MLGLGEHVYLPIFDLPERTSPYPANVVTEYMKIATAEAERGFNLQEHTITEWTIKDLLDRFEVLNKSVPLAPLRWNFAHVYTIAPQSIRRAKALGMTLGVHSVAMYSPVKTLPPLRDIQDSGIVWGLGTDSTIVAHYQPFITFWWAVTGKALHGRKVLEQTVTREEALIAHTRSNAYVLFKEKDLGSLEPGKLADLVVLDRDYLSIPADDIINIAPVMTMVGGRIVFDSSAEKSR